jgi:hypothetical protein
MIDTEMQWTGHPLVVGWGHADGIRYDGASSAEILRFRERYCVAYVGSMVFAFDGEKLHVRLLGANRQEGPHVSIEADRARCAKAQRERTARKRAQAAVLP